MRSASSSAATTPVPKGIVCFVARSIKKIAGTVEIPAPFVAIFEMPLSGLASGKNGIGCPSIEMVKTAIPVALAKAFRIGA